LLEEIKDAEEEIVSIAQRKASRHEFAALSLSKLISQKRQLIKLSSFPVTPEVLSFCLVDTG